MPFPSSAATGIDFSSVVSIVSVDLTEALERLNLRWTAVHGDKALPEREDTARARIEIALSDYTALLQLVRRSQKGSLGKRIAYATANLLHRHEAVIAGLVRALADAVPLRMPLELLLMAAKLSVWQPLREPVRVHWKPQDEGRYRPICVYGPHRKTQALMVRDMLMIAGVEAATNYATKGGGGERRLIKDVCTLIDEGKNWWWTPDIRSAFPSMHRGHFRWLPIDRRLLLNVVYLGKCAKIEMKLPEDKAAFLAYLKNAHPDLPDHVSIMDMAKLAVQRGLPQGSVLSPLMAGALVARLWSQSNPTPEAVMMSWHDDLNIGAETKAQLTFVKEQVTQHMASLSAGPIELHDCPIFSAISHRVTVLGLRLQPGRGHIYRNDGTRSIHVKPGKKRIEKYKRKLVTRLANAPEGADLQAVADGYHKSWFGAHPGWTKVPGNSFIVSQSINDSYLFDFEHGLPMGCGEISKHHKPIVGAGPKSAQ